jgi:hypothetical protein
LGISPVSAHLLLLERRHCLLPETVYTLGRQTIHLTIEEARELMCRVGVEPADTVIEVDHDTEAANISEKPLISDRTFFGMLGVKRVISIDHSAYEGAEIVLDLNGPLPREYFGIADFLIGGSTLDNVFDPAQYLKNCSRLLRPAGRLFELDVISQHAHPYCLITPAWIFDFFVVNRYDDCLLHVIEGLASGEFVHVHAYEPPPDENASDIGPPRGRVAMTVVCIAQKGSASSDDVTPVQDQYRTPDQRTAYGNSLRAMRWQRAPRFETPNASEIAKLAPRVSRSFPYRGVLRVRAPDTQSTSAGIRVVEATYGWNCRDTPQARSAVSAIYPGNATEALALVFNGSTETTWVVSTTALGDPAPGLGKDLEVLYYAIGDPTKLLRAYLAAEACGRVLDLPCHHPITG